MYMYMRKLKGNILVIATKILELITGCSGTNIRYMGENANVFRKIKLAKTKFKKDRKMKQTNFPRKIKLSKTLSKSTNSDIFFSGSLPNILLKIHTVSFLYKHI